MPLERPIPLDTRPLFRPVSIRLVTLLRGLPLESWDLPTVARAWVVRDIVAHLLDSTLRRLSFHRDGMTPPPPPRAIESDRDFVDFINTLNAQWVTSAKRLSPRVLTDLAAWKLLFNALSEDDAADAVHIDGRTDFARPLLRARSVIV